MEEGKEKASPPPDDELEEIPQEEGIKVRRTPRHRVGAGTRRMRRWAAQLSVGGILAETITLYFRNFPALSLIMLIVMSPVILLGLTVLRESFEALILLFYYFLQPIATGAIIYGIFKLKKGERIRIGGCLAVGLSRLFPLLGVAIIIFLILLVIVGIPLAVLAGLSAVIGPGLMLLFIFLIIPMYMVLCATYAGAPATVVERLNPIDAVKRSIKLTRGNRWTIFGIVFLLGILNGMVSYIVRTIIGPPSIEKGSFYFPAMGQIVESMLFYTMTAVASVLVYYTLKVRVEGADEDELASVFD